MKANHLEAKLARASKSHQDTGATKKKPPKGRHEPSTTGEVQRSSRKMDEACLQGYNFSFRVCELIM